MGRDLVLRDDTQCTTPWLRLQNKPLLSTQTLLDRFGLNYDQEVERIRFMETSSVFSAYVPQPNKPEFEELSQNHTRWDEI